MKWFRMWIDILDDPKLAVSVTAAETFRVTVLLMAYARELNNAGKIDQPDDVIAWRLRITIPELKKHLKHLSDLKIIDLKPELHFINWAKRQFLSDSSTERVKRFRVGKRNVSKLFPETPPDTDTDTETDTELKARGTSKNQPSPAPVPALKEYSETVKSLCSRLEGLIKNTDPKFKIKSMATWLKKMDELLRLDNRDEKEVSEVIDFCQADQFWSANILSPANLREKYPQLLVKMKRGGTNGSAKNSPSNDPRQAWRAREDISQFDNIKTTIVHSGGGSGNDDVI
jgi:hypothetical protein